MLVWEFVWAFACAWTPKPFNAWRLFVLRIFGARIPRRAFVHQRARIQIPWNVVLQDGACVGDRTNLYSLDLITLERDVIVAQEACLCTGTHDFSDEAVPLVTAPIVVKRGAFVGARAFVLPGVIIGEGAVVGACSVVAKNVEAFTIVAGNPTHVLRKIGG